MKQKKHNDSKGLLLLPTTSSFQHVGSLPRWQGDVSTSEDNNLGFTSSFSSAHALHESVRPDDDEFS